MAVEAVFDRYFAILMVRSSPLSTNFPNSPDFEHHLDLALREWITKRLGATVSTSSPSDESPFRGLESFEFEHADLFCGRTQAVSDVLSCLRLQRRVSK